MDYSLKLNRTPPRSPLVNWQDWVSWKKLRLDEFPNLGSVVGAEVYEHMGAPIQRVGRFLAVCHYFGFLIIVLVLAPLVYYL